MYCDILLSTYDTKLHLCGRQGLSEPEFYGDLVYKLKKIVGSYYFFSAVY